MSAPRRSPSAEWRVVKEIFDQVADLSAAERSIALEQLCGGDASLRDEVDALLQNDSGENDHLFAASAKSLSLSFGSEATEDLSGRTIGPWRIERALGRGGMGTVYLGVREEEGFEKRAAVKLVRREMATGGLVRRFRNERKILAQLEHPHIAQFLDGGTFEERPYLVMEYVDGLPIDDYCRQHRLAPRASVRIFLAVCAAVECAHRNLVVHRDLKPTNILVTADGRPKLLDFGVAKLLDTTSEAETIADFRMLTPQYASPEQLSGDPITTASDVYSLGVVLYELLAGTRPYALDGLTPRQILREVTAGAPAPIPAAAGIDRDLQAIVMKALRAPVVERYASVAELSADLERYLDGRPVLARRSGAWYRARKFVFRHRAAVIATLLVLGAIGAGVVTTLHEAAVAQRERAAAQRRFNDMRHVANSLLFELHDSLAGVPGTLAARQLIVQRAVRYLDELARTSGGDPTIQAELAEGYAHAASLTFDTTLSDRYRRTAAAIFGHLHRAHPSDARLARAYAESLASVADNEKIRGDFDASIRDYERSREIATRLLRETPADAAAKDLFDMVTMSEGIVFEEAGMPAFALPWYERSLAINSAAAAAHPNDVDAGFSLLGSEARYGTALAAAGRTNEAEAHELKAVAIAEALLVHEPRNTSYQRVLWGSRRRLGLAHLAQGKTAVAVTELSSAADVIRLLSAADPADDGHRRWLSVTLSEMGEALAREGHRDEAIAALAEARRISGALVAKDSFRLEAVIDLIVIDSSLASLRVQQGEEREAEEALAGAVPLAESLINRHSEAVRAFRALASACTAVHDDARAARYTAEARESERRLVRVSRASL